MNFEVNNNILKTAKSVAFQGEATTSDVNTNNVKTSSATTSSLSNTPEKDEFVNSKKKKYKRSIISGLTIGLGMCSIVALKTVKNLKVPTKFAEHIDFKPAKTIEEAKKFALDNFRIKEFDIGDNVDTANWVNEGLTEINNKYKGKIFMPTKVKKIIGKSEDIEETLASMSQFKISTLKFKNFFRLKAPEINNTLRINTEINTREHFIDEIDNVFINKFEELPFMQINDDFSNYIKTYENYIKENENLKNFKEDFLSKYSLTDLQKIYKNIKAYKYYRSTNHSSFKLLRELYSKEEFVSIAKKVLKEDFKSQEKLELLNQSEVQLYLSNFWKKLKLPEYKEELAKIPKSNLYQAKFSGFDTIFHELGHLNHGRNRINKYKKLGRLYKNEKLQKTMALTKDFRTFREQKIAEKVSDYAKSDILEFVAETYAQLLQGFTFDDDVMKLYKKYGGPKIPN